MIAYAMSVQFSSVRLGSKCHVIHSLCTQRSYTIVAVVDYVLGQYANTQHTHTLSFFVVIQSTSICLPCFTTHVILNVFISVSMLVLFYYYLKNERKASALSGPQKSLSKIGNYYTFARFLLLFSVCALSISNEMSCARNKYHLDAILCHPYDSQFQCDGISSH